ncbi:hypothetical protein BXZ70DRAFT_396155 [Cristinia sonorae]|uniref:Uncharacterized protein n=1 Tax=Cristinia sonorae TaxID=1940300 RepID=A0A8K0UWN6_9AGAR|nr:hypothetical protein BXZ70DRAFT_396155 [Cristinia sonorae]
MSGTSPFRSLYHRVIYGQLTSTVRRPCLSVYWLRSPGLTLVAVQFTSIMLPIRFISSTRHSMVRRCEEVQTLVEVVLDGHVERRMPILASSTAMPQISSCTIRRTMLVAPPFVVDVLQGVLLVLYTGWPEGPQLRLDRQEGSDLYISLIGNRQEHHSNSVHSAGLVTLSG